MSVSGAHNDGKLAETCMYTVWDIEAMECMKKNSLALRPSRNEATDSRQFFLSRKTLKPPGLLI